VPAALCSQEDYWYSFLLEPESTPGPLCGWKDEVKADNMRDYNFFHLIIRVMRSLQEVRQHGCMTGRHICQHVCTSFLLYRGMGQACRVSVPLGVSAGCLRTSAEFN
jgi:hypothetical protein